MKLFKHPAEYLSPKLIADIKQYGAEAEQLQRLHPNQLKLIQQQGWFNLFVPTQLNGLGLSLPKALHVEEALAYADGSVGWTVTLCAGAAWFFGFLHPDIRQLIFSNKNACLAGSGKASGIAHKTGDGFLVNGKWDYATGAPYATAFTANCILHENDKPLLDTAGNPVIQSFLFLKEEVTINKNWNRMGMMATGSHGFSVKNILIPATRTFIIDSSYANLPDAIYHYPFLALAQTTLAVNTSGMAMRFLDICKNDFSANKYKILHKKLGDAYVEMNTLRQLFYKAVAKSWIQCKGQKRFAKTFQKIEKRSKKLAYKYRKIVDDLYPICGMQAANPSTEINRVWRNMHTASQHSIFNG